MAFLNVDKAAVSRLVSARKIRRFPPFVLAAVWMLALSTGAFAQLPSPSHGWNLGNTMEATCGVGCWGAPPTQALINSVAAAGFNTVRVPCAWMTHSDSSGTIDPTYMSQVKQVVDWCYAKNLYVIVNDHWDGGWFDGSNFNTYDPTINSRMQTMWTQIANTFKNYDSRLLFACANEPPTNTQTQSNVLYQYFQNWVTYMRATGGTNSTRWLIVQAPSCNIDYATNWVTSMPTDPAHHVMLECHDYSPYQFTLMGSDQSWGAMFYFWGAAYHVTGTLASRNATWGEESYIDGELDKCKAFVNRGIPVLVGEWRAEPKGTESDLTGQYITQNYNSCTYWDYYYHNAANSRGVYVTCWDTPGQIFNWTTGAVVDQTQINALLGRSYVQPVSGLGGGGTISNGNHTLTPQNATGSRLDANGWGSTNGTKAQIWQQSGAGNQSWSFANQGGSIYTISPSYATSICLDVSGWGTSNGTIVQLWTCGGGNNQKWSAHNDGGNVFDFAPQHATGSRLDVSGSSSANGTQVEIWQSTGGNNQKWAVN